VSEASETEDVLQVVPTDSSEARMLRHKARNDDPEGRGHEATRAPPGGPPIDRRALTAPG
jgi:hypothetical protein